MSHVSAQTDDCLFHGDSSTGVLSELATDDSALASSWSVNGATNIRTTDTTGVYSASAQKTVDCRFQAISGATTGVLYSFDTSTPAGLQRLTTNSSGTLTFAWNASNVSTYTITNWTGTNVFSISWTFEPNPATTGSSDAVRHEVHIWNETLNTFEQHVFFTAVMNSPGSNSTHSFWATYGGTSNFTGVEYLNRLSKAFHSSTESFETFIGADLPTTVWSQFLAGTTPRFRVFGGSSLVLYSTTGVAMGFAASPNRTPGQWAYQSVGGDFDIRADVTLADITGTNVATLTTRHVGLCAGIGNGNTDWFEMSLAGESSAPTLRTRWSIAGASGAVTTSSTTATEARYHLRLTRVGQVFTGFFRLASAGLALSDNTSWTQRGTVDRTATPVANTMQIGLMFRSLAAAVSNTYLVVREVRGFPVNTFDPVTLLGEERREFPMPPSTNALCNDGAFAGPIYAMAARAVASQDMLLFSPVVNDVLHGTTWLNTSATAWRWTDGSFRFFLQYLFRRPIPAGANRLHIRAFVQSDYIPGIGGPFGITVQVRSMSQPGPFYRPPTSPAAMVTYSRNVAITADHDNGLDTGAWLDFGLTKIALDNDGFTYLAFGFSFPNSSTQWIRIRSVIATPVYTNSGGNSTAPVGGAGLG